MLRVIFCLLLFLGTNTFVYAKEEPAVSTEGIEFEQDISTKPESEQKSDWRQKRKENRIYFKTKKAIKRQNYKRSKKQKKLEYLEKRLEMKKQQLEVFTPNQEKGEKEE